jgi:glycosyltransferase involved in cell wall biosynthesis
MNSQQQAHSDRDLASVELPKISIVVPNYNGGSTILATLKSLVDQNYPELEIVVVDGGSTDNSVDIIQQFEPYITWWVSERDNGQSQAINKGISQCTGEVINWLCSDDLLAPGALYLVGKTFSESPHLDVLVGRGSIFFKGENSGQPKKEINFWMTLLDQLFKMRIRSIIYSETDEQSYVKAPTLKQLELMSIYNPIAQPSCFYRRRLLDRPQPIDESYHYAMDTELWNYFRSRGAQWKCIDDVLSVTIQDGQNKTSTGGYKVTLELERIYKTYNSDWIPLTFWHRRFRYPLERFLASHTNRLWLYLIGPIWIGITLMLAPFYGLNRVWVMRWKRWV